MLKGAHGQGSSPAVTHWPASTLLLTSCSFCCGEGNEKKKLLWKKVSGGQAIGVFFGLEKIKSWRPYFCCLSVLQENKTAVWREDRTEKQKEPTEMGLFHCPCSWEWFLWTSVSKRWVLLGLWLSSMLFRSSLGQGLTRADGAGGLPPSHQISCEHPSLRKRELDICLHLHVAVLEFAGEQLPAPEKLLFPLSTTCSRWQISTVLATDTISK